MEVDQLEVCSDSQLVVNQIEDSYNVRGEKMILYLKKVRELLKKFRTSSGQIRSKGRKFLGGCPGKVSNGVAGRSG